MIRHALIAVFALLPTPILAHAGHLGDLAGHDHWVAGAALGAALGVAAWGWWKGRKEQAEAGEDSAQGETEAEAQEA